MPAMRWTDGVLIGLATAAALTGGAACKGMDDSLPASRKAVAELDAEAAKARALAAEMDARWRKTILASEKQPIETAGACPLVTPGPKAALEGIPSEQKAKLEQQLVAMQHSMSSLGRTDRIVVRFSELASAASPRRQMIDHAGWDSEHEHTEWTKSTLRDALAKAREMSQPAWWTWDIVVVVDDEARPDGVDVKAGTFQTGAIGGRSYLYDYQADRVVCAGRFQAQNAARVDYRYDLGGSQSLEARRAVRTDLDAQALEAGVQALQAVK
jgi:hypothetical protein